uniref:Uncharacterized protein n=1 Tax=Brassica campestris TaxID=3711 RepID=A0A3P6BIG0_BRACM|nr:unnamed protein product [Brassica rapa]
MIIHFLGTDASSKRETKKKKPTFFAFLSSWRESSTLVGKQKNLIIASPQPHYRL